MNAKYKLAVISFLITFALTSNLYGAKIQGVYFERWLPKLSYQDTKWKKWYEKHPHTKIMK